MRIYLLETFPLYGADLNYFVPNHSSPPPPLNYSHTHTQAETCKLAAQLKGAVLPIEQPTVKYQARAVTDDERKYSVFETMRVARADAKLVGVREKRAKRKEEEAKMKKK